MNPQVSLPPNASSGSVLQLQFEKRADRWSHHWVVLTPDQPAWTLISSLEGTPDQSFPPSPPLQEIQQHQVDGHPVLLGLGMAGKSHWSASFTVETARNPMGSLLADIACLEKPAAERPHTQLGTSYGIAEDLVASTVRVDDHRLRWTLPVGVIELSVRVPGRLHCDSPSRCSIQPAPEPVAPGKSFRWAYSIGWLVDKTTGPSTG